MGEISLATIAEINNNNNIQSLDIVCLENVFLHS